VQPQPDSVTAATAGWFSASHIAVSTSSGTTEAASIQATAGVVALLKTLWSAAARDRLVSTELGKRVRFNGFAACAHVTYDHVIILC